jgi:hypothetical protein
LQQYALALIPICPNVHVPALPADVTHEPAFGSHTEHVQSVDVWQTAGSKQARPGLQ